MNRLPRYFAGLFILAAACSEDTEAPVEPSLAQLQESPGSGAVPFRDLTATGNAEGVDVTGAP